MCCFSGPVRRVSGTSIFARLDGDEQFLVYAMTVDTEAPVAMVLPLPVDPDRREAAVTFVSLAQHADFFTLLEAMFPEEATRSVADGVIPLGPPKWRLVVHDVGEFQASYVPSIADFARLDPRFRIDDAVWRELGEVRDYGFAVFQLKPGARSIHPMAMRFHTRASRSLFFPTVHVHDGTVPAVAEFDHSLYAQCGSRTVDVDPGEWDEPTSPQHAPGVDGFVPPGFTGSARAAPAKLVDDGFLLPQGVARQIVRGRRSNQDTWVRI